MPLPTARQGQGGGQAWQGPCASLQVCKPASWASVPADRRSARCSRRMWMRCQMPRSRRTSVGCGSWAAWRSFELARGGGTGWDVEVKLVQTAPWTDRVERAVIMAVSKHRVAGCRLRIRCESHQSESERRPPPPARMAMCEAQSLRPGVVAQSPPWPAPENHHHHHICGQSEGRKCSRE